jgi:hypothetical protein
MDGPEGYDGRQPYRSGQRMVALLQRIMSPVQRPAGRALR